METSAALALVGTRHRLLEVLPILLGLLLRLCSSLSPLAYRAAQASISVTAAMRIALALAIVLCAACTIIEACRLHPASAALFALAVLALATARRQP